MRNAIAPTVRPEKPRTINRLTVATGKRRAPSAFR
jgi:hypothetical protein